MTTTLTIVFDNITDLSKRLHASHLVAYRK